MLGLQGPGEERRHTPFGGNIEMDPDPNSTFVENRPTNILAEVRIHFFLAAFILGFLAASMLWR